MPKLDEEVKKIFDVGFSLHQQGKLEEAEVAYNEILKNNNETNLKKIRRKTW